MLRKTWTVCERFFFLYHVNFENSAENVAKEFKKRKATRYLKKERGIQYDVTVAIIVIIKCDTYI